jgi:hypothetical protein
MAEDSERYKQGADDKAHGTHGRGVGGREKDLGEAEVEPGVSKSSNPPCTMGDPGWGSEASGGSTIDRRPPENKGNSGNK